MNPPGGMRLAPSSWSRRCALAAVVVVAALLVVSRMVVNASHDARAVTLMRMAQITRALDRYAVDNGGYIPTTRQGLRALCELPDIPPQPRNWRGPYLADPKLKYDGWGRPFRYVAPGGGDPPRPYDLWSLGADNAEGGTGAAADINSWKTESPTP